MTQSGRFPLPDGESMTNGATDPKASDEAAQVSQASGSTLAALGGNEVARDIARGVTRLLMAQGIASLQELPLPDGRRADVVGLSSDGTITIVEIKSSVGDFRSDHKWAAYRAYCDRLYFAVDVGFPTAILPADTGLILADRYGGAFVREPPLQRLSSARRKVMIMQFGRVAAGRLSLANDPGLTLERP